MHSAYPTTISEVGLAILVVIWGNIFNFCQNFRQSLNRLARFVFSA